MGRSLRVEGGKESVHRSIRHDLNCKGIQETPDGLLHNSLLTCPPVWGAANGVDHEPCNSIKLQRFLGVSFVITLLLCHI